jgi:dipeptidyl aminopeptidase/acylaminoacyl peptidase
MRRIRAHKIRALLGLAFVVVLVAGAAYLAAGYVVYDRSTRVAAHCGGQYADYTPARFAVDGVDATPYLMPSYESASFPSRGDPGVAISGWWVPGAPNAPAVIQVHGLNGCKRAPGNLLEAGMLHRLGYAVLLVDLRNEGDSTVTNGRFAGGVIEYKDVLGAWDWIQSARGVAAARIGLAGMSMGAATSLIAAGQEPRVAAVWEDSSFADINVAISDEVARNGYPRFLAPAATLVGRLAGVDIASLGPLDAVARLNGRSVAVIHGTADTRMPVKHAHWLIDAIEAHGGRPYVWLPDGVEHTQAIVTYPDEYERRLGDFFGAAIGVPAAARTMRPAA